MKDEDSKTAAAAVDITADSSMDVESTSSETPNGTPTKSGGEGSPDDDNAKKLEEDSAKPKGTGGSAKKRKSVGTAGALNKTYIQLVQESIVGMNDRTGSSLAAIKKYILTQHPELGGPHFASRVNLALKNGLTSKPPKFAKVRASFKIAKEFREAERNKKRRAAAQIKKKVEIKKKETAVVRKEREFAKKLQAVPPEVALRLKQDKERAATRKAAEEARARQVADRLRRRRFPMEDTKLHKEDRELNVKPPSAIQQRPNLPYFWNLTVPLHLRKQSGKTSGSILANSKVDHLEGGGDTRGLVPDLLAVYHFFRGDVHFTLDSGENEDQGGNPIVPEFTLKQLIFAVDQVINGNARRSKQIPPLLVHLFVTSLQILFSGDSHTATVEGNSGNKLEQQLRTDLHQYLWPALTPASWPDVTHLYMDAMERFYGTDASRDPTVLQPLQTDLEFLMGRRDEPVFDQQPAVPATPTATGDEGTTNNNQRSNTHHPLPDGYSGYLGDKRGVLFRAHYKLQRQDPWLLTAEELLAVLRALTEDILATHPAAAADLANREEAMQELLRAKRAADNKFRKVRLAFEGPKRPPPASKPKPKDGEEENNVDEGEENKAEEKPFKPTATKKQFETAKKQQDKAVDAYEQGIRNLVARTEPIGYDRNFNAVYCFRHDPEVLYIEDKRPPAIATVPSNIPLELQFQRMSWHVIESTSLLDQFLSSLDIRGKREHDLHAEIVGPPSLRDYLYDDVKERADAKAKKKEKENLLERLEKARIKCDEETGRRSGRLAGQAEVELSAIQVDIDELDRKASGNVAPAPEIRDYSELTGYNALLKFEMAGRVETRRTREKKAEAKARKLPLLRCSKLISTGNIDGTGLVGILVSSMLELEERCERLVPWDRKDVARPSWISQLEGAVPAWNSLCQEPFGSSFPETNGTPANRDSMDQSSGSATKRRRFDSPGTSAPVSGISIQEPRSILPILRQPLLDLEERVADLTNVALATQDADLADENMSIDSTDDQLNKERLERSWKKQVYKIRLTPAKKHSQIRELLVSAISAARKAHLSQVVAELRAALLLYHPTAASECKVAAIKVLEATGDYDVNEDEEESDDEADATNEDQDESAPSVLSAEAAILRSSLGGSDDARREDWVSIVKSAKTISRLASLTAAFITDATERIEKIEYERDALLDAIKTWTKADERDAKQRDGKNKGAPSKSSRDMEGPSEVWANVRYTDQICMAKAEAFPWWPAKKCIAKHSEIANSLEALGRTLVAFIGEMGGLRVVKTAMLKPFTGTLVDNDGSGDGEGAGVAYTKEMKTQLDDCMAMARRILRGHAHKK
jgi:linker histone H1 and H5 family/Williams-Beuren syndrome DDT (WSD), D-TOX E motif